MFTTDNTSGFDRTDLDAMNEALEVLMAGLEADADREQVSQSYSALLNNAWCSGATAEELVAAVA